SAVPRASSSYQAPAGQDGADLVFDGRWQRAARRADIGPAQAELGQRLLDHAHVVGARVGRAEFLEPAYLFPDLHRLAEVAGPQGVEHGQRQFRGDVGQARGEAVRAAGPVRGRGQLGRAGQPGEPVDPGVPGHGGERAGVADAVLDADHVRRPVGKRRDVRARDALVSEVQDDAQVGNVTGDRGVVVDPAFTGDVGVDRLVDHDHAGAVVPGVPGRLDRGGDVVADPGQQLGLVVGGARRRLDHLPGLSLAERVELAGVAVRGDDYDPAVDQAPGQRGVGVPV